MTIDDIVAGAIKVGDELQINEWDNHFKVCAVSEGYILAHHGEMEYTKEERTNVLSGKEAPWLISLCDHLGDKLHQIGDQFDIVSAD